MTKNRKSLGIGLIGMAITTIPSENWLKLKNPFFLLLFFFLLFFFLFFSLFCAEIIRVRPQCKPPAPYVEGTSPLSAVRKKYIVIWPRTFSHSGWYKGKVGYPTAVTWSGLPSILNGSNGNIGEPWAGLPISPKSNLQGNETNSIIWSGSMPRQTLSTIHSWMKASRDCGQAAFHSFEEAASNLQHCLPKSSQREILLKAIPTKQGHQKWGKIRKNRTREREG